MYRFFALALVFTAVACGGGGSASSDPTATTARSSNTTTGPTQQVAGDRTQTPTSPTPAAAPDSYEVVDGDTLWDIALRFETTVEALVEANDLASADDLTVGQTLKIVAAPAETPTTQAATPTATATAQ